MKKMMLLLAAVILSAAAFGCQKNQTEPTTVAPQGDETQTPPQEDRTAASDWDDDEFYFGDLSSERYDGYNYRILVRQGNTNTQYFEEPQEDIVDNAIYERNKYVENKFGVTITVSESSNPEYETDALNSILAGDDAYDVIFPHARAAFSYAVQGACANLRDISSLHLDKPWWAADIVESCTINGKLYVLDGDISTSGLSATHCLYFNKRIFDDLGFEYPYDMVRSGEWTFDEFAYLVRKGSADLNGDGLIDEDNDRYGFTTNMWSAPIVMPYTGGKRIYSKDESGKLFMSLYSDKTVNMYASLFGLMNSVAAEYNLPSSVFKSGRLMFMDGGLGGAKSLRDMDDEFGIVPYPKYDEDDSYATITNGVAPLMIMPITVADRERSGAITEALCAYGSRYVIPAFYDVTLKTKYSRDTESEEMMDIIRASRVFDLGYLAGGPFSSTGYELASSDSSNFASFYAERKDQAQVSLDNFIRDYGGE